MIQKICMVRHWDEKKPCSYRATVAELASDGCPYLIMQFKCFLLRRDTGNTVKMLPIPKCNLWYIGVRKSLIIFMLD